ncbi:MAG: hypothetical protein WDZ59_05800 [Pirellulales bacterium]
MAKTMRIEPEQTIAGFPAIRVRELMRKLGHDGMGSEFVEHCLGATPGQSEAVLNELEQLGFLERTHEWWSATLKGRALALATAAKPIRRSSAEKILERFLERVEKIRLDPVFLLRVERVDLFGSMTTEQLMVNDVDLGVSLQRKEQDAERYEELANKLRRSAAAKGRSFPRDADWFSWPTTHVMLFLKSRSRALSIHPLDDWVLDQPGRRTIYLHHYDAPGQNVMFDTDGL